MAVTVRRYQTPSNWTFVDLKPLLIQMMTEAGLASPNEEEGGAYSFNLQRSSGQVNTEPSKNYYIDTPTLRFAKPGAFIKGFYYGRNGAGDISYRAWQGVCGGFGTTGGHAVTVTFDGSATATCFLNGHELTVGERFYNTTADAKMPVGFYTVASVVDRATFTVTLGASAAAGVSSITGWFGLVGSATRNASSVVTTTMPGHPFQVGDSVYIHNHVENPGGWWFTHEVRTVTAVTATTFTYTAGGGGVATQSCTIFAPYIVIPGTAIGGTSPTNDEIIGITSTRGKTKTGLPVTDRWPVGNNFNLAFTFNGTPDKRHGQVFCDIGLDTNNRWIRFNWNTRMLLNGNWGSGISGVFGIHSWEIPYVSDLTFSDYVNPLQITTYQSDVDPNFVVIRFTQLNTTWNRSLIPPKWSFSPAAPFTADQKINAATVSITGSRLIMRGAGDYMNNAWGNYDDTNYRDESYNAANGLYYDSGTYGPVIVGLPIYPHQYPPMYVYPPDFGWLVYRNSLLYDDILQVSEFEEYEVINASSAGAFVARIT